MVKSKETVMAEMDSAAEVAGEELVALLLGNEAAVLAVAEWWRKHYLGAGHKRLGRLLVQRVVKQR